MDDFFERAKGGFQKTVEAISKKSSEFIAISQCKSAIGIAEDNLAKNYEEIGRYVYENFVSDDIADGFIDGKCERIKELQDEISNLKEKLAEIRNLKECPSCGQECSFDAVYCSSCGYEFYKSGENE